MADTFLDNIKSPQINIENTKNTDSFYFALQTNDTELLEKVSSWYNKRFEYPLSGIGAYLCKVISDNSLCVWEICSLDKFSERKTNTILSTLLQSNATKVQPIKAYVCCFGTDTPIKIFYNDFIGTASAEEISDLSRELLNAQGEKKFDLKLFTKATTVQVEDDFTNNEQNWIAECTKESIANNPALDYVESSLLLNDLRIKVGKDTKTYKRYIFEQLGFSPAENDDEINFTGADSDPRYNNLILGEYDAMNRSIIMYTSIINSVAQSLNYRNVSTSHLYEILFKKVLIHEFAHAMLDERFNVMSNDRKLQGQYHPSENIWYKDFASIAMEESVANHMTIEFIKRMKCDDVNVKAIVEDFIRLQQPAIYAFGLRQNDAHIDWRMWKYTKKASPNIPQSKDINFLNYINHSQEIPYSIEDYEKSLYGIAYQIINK